MTATDLTTAPEDVGSPGSEPGWAVVDGCEAVARIAYACSEVIALYPITPASPMGEAADRWCAAGRPNLWGTVPELIEMQSEAGAAGTLHGGTTAGALATTFTASQGLLLMIPDMYKIAGELAPAVIHVAARSLATHALSIFGDHSDVMAARATGWAMLSAASVQEAQDFAAVAHAATLRARVPFVAFMDGFRTSHELHRIRLLPEDDLRALLDPAAIAAHRARGLSPDHPVLRGSAQNPDTFFQAREAASPYHAAVPGIVAAAFDRLAERTGRRYGLVDYHGAPDAEAVLVVMGSAAGAAAEAVEAMLAAGEKVGLVQVRLFRPFPTDAFLAAVPPTVRGFAVLDRTKEPGAPGEPLFADVVGTLAERAERTSTAMPRVIGGRYGLASKEFTPRHAKAALDEVRAAEPVRRFTVGIVDDVSHTSLVADPAFDTDDAEVRAVFYGLGSDGTVGASKQAATIIGDHTGLWVQGAFLYDSKKAGAVTVSHLRFAGWPIRSTYLIEKATFVACHQFQLLERLDVLRLAEPGATFLLNSPYGPEEVWDHLPAEVQARIVELDLRLFVIDAHRLARETGMPGRINTLMLPCFMALSGMLPRDEAVEEVKAHFEAAYAKRGRGVVLRNEAAIDRAIEELFEVAVPGAVTSSIERRPPVPAGSPDFVTRVTAAMLAGEGDLLPVSALPADGTFPTGTARYEKRMLAQDLPVWDPTICIDCARCTLVCPHAAIRLTVVPPDALAGVDLPSKDFRSRAVPDHRLVIQVAPDDCTGCGVCVDVCPARSKEQANHKALDMAPVGDRRERERARWESFLDLPLLDPELLGPETTKGSQVREPLFEFSGACAGCGETPYLKLLTQQCGDRAVVANATGCSSIYGGNLPTTPWSVDAAGRGPAWANSLFEDNAEFGLGIRMALDTRADLARRLLVRLAPVVGDGLVEDLLTATQDGDAGVRLQRGRVVELRSRLEAAGPADRALAAELDALADDLVRRSVWIVGGDGWAYDIGFGGVDHVLASGRNVNLLVLDTEVYSNTGGQASKSTPRAAVAKFATGGKVTPKKDLGMTAMGYGNVYVAQVAIGANDVQAVKAFAEAEAWPGPSLLIAYSTCIAHGIDMSRSMTHQHDAVRSGYWPLYRYHPGSGEHDQPFQLDSHDPTIPFVDFARSEGRFAMLARSDPDGAPHLFALEQADIDERWRLYRQLAGIERTVAHEDPDGVAVELRVDDDEGDDA